MDNSFCSTSPRKPKLIYKEKIGRGSYGEVWSVEWRESIAAAKRIHKTFFESNYDPEIKKDRITEFMKECGKLRDLDHDNIVKMLEVLLPENKSPVLIMELMHCDLLSYIKKSKSNPKVSPCKVVSIALGVARGLEYLHGLPNPIIHRDLASRNILLTEDGQPKIADLGVSKILLDAGETNATPRQGALLYAAPETYKNVRNFTAKYGVKADVFSFGVVLLEMNVGHEPLLPPRESSGKTTEIQRRQKDIVEMQDETLKTIVIDCLQEKSRKRPSASKIVRDLERIKSERERVQRTETVSFERLNGKPLSPCDHHFKVLLLGNSNVGKSSLFELLTNPVFDIDTSKIKATVDKQAVVLYFKYKSQILEMEIVDTSGEERYFALTSSYYRDVDGVFLVYDVSDKVSLRSLPFWIQNLRKYNSNDNLQMLLVGNKVDLRQTTDPDDLVPQERAVEYASSIKSPYVETSAKDFDSVMTMYNKMVEILIITISPEDITFQEKEAGSTIQLPSSPNMSRTWKDYICPSCKTS